MVTRPHFIMAAVALAAATHLGCGEDPAASKSILVALSTDVPTPRKFDSLLVRVSRNGVGVLSKEYDYPGVAGLPDSLLLTQADALTEEQKGQTLRVTVEGKLHGETVINRSASLTFPDRAVVLRMPLCNQCLGNLCGDGQTCKSGVCVSESIDGASLPGDDGAQALEDPECPGKAPSCSGVCGTPGCGACPTGDRIDVGGIVTIDATEVTRTAYETWLDTNPHPGDVGVIPECAVATNFAVDQDCMAKPEVCSGDCGQHPQVCIRQCAAHAYCAWAGERLCSGVGGKVVLFESPPTDAEWYHACAGPDLTTYPYGPDPMPGNCNDNGTMTLPVGTSPACVGENPKGPFDMTGNVAEFDESCTGPRCRARGGHFKNAGFEATCTDWFIIDRTEVSPLVGFRCCAGP